MDALDVFHPDRMAKRILGMGDVISLVERAQQNFDEDEAENFRRKCFRIHLVLMIFFLRFRKLRRWVT